MRSRNLVISQRYHSPCGDLVLGSVGDRLCLCDWAVERHHGLIRRRLSKSMQADFVEGDSAVIRDAVSQLDEYFTGKRKCFDVSLLFVGSDFQKTVWHKLLEIPFGETISYGELAGRLGCPKSARAVANANGANAISIFVPCHRVIGSNHQLAGYGGGLSAKRFLLSMEQPSLFLAGH